MGTIKFKVALNEEDKKAKKFREVEFRVDMSKVSRELLEKLACSAQVVRWQGEIRSHWELPVPKEVEFGKPLFSVGRTTSVKVTVTDEDVKKYLEKMSPAQKLQKTIEMMEDAGLTIPDEMLEKLNELTDAEEMAEVAKRLAE